MKDKRDKEETVNKDKIAKVEEKEKQANKTPEVQGDSKPKMVRTKQGSYVPKLMVVGNQEDVQSVSKVPSVIRAERTAAKVEEKPEAVADYIDEDEDESEVPLEKSNKRIFIISVVLMVLIILATGAVFYFRTKLPAEVEEETGEIVLEEAEETNAEVEEAESPEKEESKESEEEVGEEKDLKKSEISLEILNGSGVTGLAGEIADKFEALGYEIAKVGNAEKVSGNKLYVKPEISEQVGVLLSDAKSELGINSITGDIEGSSVDARIILGTSEED